MKLIDKITELPKISIKDLEQKAISSHFALNPQPLAQFIPKSHHQIAQEIKVVSPFYHRLDHHTGKCQCQYHRLKRYKQGLSRLRLKHLGRSYNLREQGQDSEIKMQSTRDQDSEYQSGGIKGSKSTVNLLQPLGRKSWKPEHKGQILKQKKDEKSLQKNQSQELKLPKAARQERYRTDWKVSQVNSKLSAMNPNFLNLISRRLENNIYKSKYLKMLFGFIKMKANQDRLYLYKSKAYLKNSLNILLNHFSMEKLMSKSELTQQNHKKIAYHMACKEENVISILQDLKSTVEEMEAYLQWTRQAEKEKRRQKEIQEAQLQRQQKQFAQNQRKNGSEQFLQEEYQVLLNNSKSCSSLFGNEKGIDQNDIKNWETTGGESHLSTNKYFPMRKSHRNLDFKNYQENQNNKKNIVCYTQQSELQNSDSKEKDIKTKPYFRGSRTFVRPSKGRSPRATVTGVQHESQLNCTGQSKFSRNKTKKPTVFRKAQVNKRIQFLEFDPKYKDINYRQYCNKQDFMHLIEQIERLDRNDEERAIYAFHRLKISKFLDDPIKIDHLLKTFDPLFSQKCQEKLLKHIVAVKDARYIEKLMKELDHTLIQVKRTDPRNLDTEELFPYKADKTLQEPHHKLRIAQYKGHHVMERRSIGGKIIYYEADQKVERHITQELNQKMQLQQANLDEIQTENIDPSLTKIVDHKLYPQQKSNLKKLAFNKNQQKKILSYMHQNHPNIFNYLNESISEVCRNMNEQTVTDRA